MKADRNFRMRQTTKRILATILDSHRRGQYKRLMIDAQLTEQSLQRRAHQRNEATND